MNYCQGCGIDMKEDYYIVCWEYYDFGDDATNRDICISCIIFDRDYLHGPVMQCTRPNRFDKYLKT